MKKIMGKSSWLIISAVVLLAMLPVFAQNDFQLHILIICCIYVVLTISLNLILLTGQLSIAHAAFMGIGAYTSALLSLYVQLPVLFCMVLGAIASGLIGFLIGMIVLRITGIYFVIVTFALGEIVVLVFLTWEKLFGGPNGLYDIPAPAVNVLGLWVLSFSSRASYYYIALLAVLVSAFLYRRLDFSYIGWSCRAIAKSERLAEAIGINAMFYKLMTFSIGNFFAGLAGALYAHYLHYIGPDYFSFSESVHIIVATVVGGVGTLYGSIIGAVFLTLLPELLKGSKHYEMIIYGTILILVVRFMPQGLYGGILASKRLFLERKKRGAFTG